MIKTLNQVAPIINLYPYNSNLQLKHIVNDTVVVPCFLAFIVIV